MKISALAVAAAVIVAPLSVLLLSACGSPSPASPPSPAGASGPASSASTPSGTSGSYTYSTAPGAENATGIALNASTDAYFNRRYGTYLPASAEQCEPASPVASSNVLWQCGYVIRGNDGTTVKITGPHSWEIVSAAGN
jgi:hypothetical protein